MEHWYKIVTLILFLNRAFPLQVWKSIKESCSKMFRWAARKVRSLLHKTRVLPLFTSVQSRYCWAVKGKCQGVTVLD